MEAIEAQLRARRGAEHVLSPRDFALARTWHEAGVPLATVLVGIDRAFDSAADVSSLAFCRGRVEQLLASGSRPRSPLAPPQSVPLHELSPILDALGERLTELSPGPRACFEPALRKLREVQDLVAVASRPNWDYLRQKLRAIDDAVTEAVTGALSPEDVAGFRAEAERTLARLRGRVDADALHDALERYTIQRGRERLGLPRVSLL